MSTAIVIFTLSVALVTGKVVTPGGLAFDFIKIVGLGLLIGAGVGLAISQVIRHVDDPMIEITLGTISPTVRSWLPSTYTTQE